MDYKKQAEKIEKKSSLLVSALTGSGMALILFGKVFKSHGDTFLTIVPSVLLVICLWWPFVDSRVLLKRKE